jgi:hypothetical protein
MITAAVKASPERTRSAWLLLAAWGGLFTLALPFFMQQVYVADDLGEFHLPLRDFYARQLPAGEPFDWMPSLYGGFYVVGEGQLGGYHPWHWLLYRTLPLGAAFNLELLASYPWLFAGCYLLLRRIVDRRDAALIGALAFTFSGFCLLHFIHPNAVAVVAHLPWLLWAVDVALRGSTSRSRAAARVAAGLLLASQLLLGYPQYVWFSLLAIAALVVFQVATRRCDVRGVAGLGVALLAGILIGSLQWLATWQFLNHSVREQPNAAFANTGSMPLLNLVQVAAPYLFVNRVVGQNTHELGMYLGAVPLGLCVLLLASRQHWGVYRPLVWALLVGLGLAIMLAAGEFGGLYQLQQWVPLANRFRFPCRAIVLVQLCTAVLAAIGATLLFNAADSRRDTSPTVARSLVLLIVASLALAIAGPMIWPEHVAAAPLIWAGPGLILLAVVLLLAVQRGIPGSGALLALFTAADLVVYGASYAIYGRTANLHEYVAAAPRPPENAGERVAMPGEPGGVRIGDRAILAGLQRIDGYAGLEPAKRLDYRQRRSLELAGVGWLWLPQDSGHNGRGWVRIGPTGPRARLVSRCLPPERIGDVSRLPWDEAIAEPPQALDESSPGKVHVVDDRPGKLELTTDAPGRQLLVTTESYDPGWTAAVDGRPSPVVRVNGDFLGCTVVPGVHRVTFEYRPRARQLGGQLALLGVALLGVAACHSRVASHTK